MIEAIHTAHNSFEPAITVTEVLRSQCKTLDDRDTPHRWWNRAGRPRRRVGFHPTFTDPHLHQSGQSPAK